MLGQDNSFVPFSFHGLCLRLCLLTCLIAMALFDEINPHWGEDLDEPNLVDVGGLNDLQGLPVWEQVRWV